MDYVVAYPSNLRALAALNLCAAELKVVAYILDAMEWGNLIGFSQKAACEALGMKRSNMSVVFRKLHQKGVIVENNGHMYVNSNLFAKGLRENMYPETRKRLSAAQGEVHGIERAHDYQRAPQPRPGAQEPQEPAQARVVAFRSAVRAARSAPPRRGSMAQGRPRCKLPL